MGEAPDIATISLLKLSEWGVVGDSIGIFQDETKIPPKVAARFLDAGAKVYTDLPSAVERFPREFPDVVVP